MTDPTQDPSKDDATSDDIDWAAAMAEQAAGTNQSTQAEGLAGAADDWAAALAEQTAAENARNLQSSAAAGKDADAVAPSATSAADTGAQSSAASQASSSEQTGVAQAAEGVFKPLVDKPSDTQSDIDMIMDIPVQLSVELGRTRLTIRN